MNERTDTERLEWIFQQDTVIGTCGPNPAAWERVAFACYQKTFPADLVGQRAAIDRAMDAERSS